MNKKGFTIVEIMIVAFIIALLAAVAVPSYIKVRTNAQTNICAANMKQLEVAKAQAAVDDGLEGNSEVSWDSIVPDYVKTTPTCPLGLEYSLNTVNEDVSHTSPDE